MENLQNLQIVELRERHAFSQRGGILATIVLVIVGSVLLSLGMYLKTKFEGQVDTSNFSTEQQDTFDDITNNTNDALSLSGWALWVLVAIGLIALIAGVVTMFS